MIEAPADPRVVTADDQTTEPIPKAADPRLVVECLTGVVVASKEPSIPTITQGEEDEEDLTPAPSTRTQQTICSVTQEACLAAIKISNTTPTTQNLASQNSW